MRTATRPTALLPAPCRGTDKGLSSVSTLFNSLHVLLQRKYQRAKAEKMVRRISADALVVSTAPEMLVLPLV
jgi:hypothetical protein